ncbi:MAG: 3-keto-disaccharide hydrolase [Pirellulaceae bacterium]
MINCILPRCLFPPAITTAFGRVALCVALLAGVPTGNAQTNDQPADPVPEFQPLFDGQSLAGWKIADFGGRDDVEVRDGEIVVGMGYPLAGIIFDGDPPAVDNYVLELSACKREGTDFFCCVTFPVRDQSCSFVLGGWGGTVTGISSVNGELASDNATRTLRRYERDRWYHVRITVQGNQLVCHIDDEQVVDLDLQDVELTVHPALEHCQPFSICAFETRASWKDIRIARIEGEE